MAASQPAAILLKVTYLKGVSLSVLCMLQKWLAVHAGVITNTHTHTHTAGLHLQQPPTLYVLQGVHPRVCGPVCSQHFPLEWVVGLYIFGCAASGAAALQHRNNTRNKEFRVSESCHQSVVSTSLHTSSMSLGVMQQHQSRDSCQRSDRLV